MSIEDSDAALRIVEAGRRRVADRVRDAFTRQTDSHPELGLVDPTELERLVQEATDQAGASLWRISLAEAASTEFGVAVPEALHHPAVASAERLIGAPAQPTAAAPVAPALAPAPAPEPVAPEPEEYTEPEWMREATTADDSYSEPEWMSEPEPEPVAPEPAPVPEPAPAPVAAAPAPETAAPADTALRVAAVHTSGIEALKPGDKDLELRLSDAGLDVIKRSSGAAIGRLEWTEITAVDIEEAKRGLRGRKRSQSLQVRTANGQARFELPGLGDEEAAEHLEPMLQRMRDSGRLAAGAD